MESIPVLQHAYVMTLDKGLILRDDIPVPKSVPKGYLLLKIRGSSICGTDLGMMKGEKDPWTKENVIPFMRKEDPLVMGHELYGKVVKTGPGSKIKVGTIGASESHYPCPACIEKGIDGHTCEHYGILGVWGAKNGRGRSPVIGGAYSEYIMIPELNFYPVGDLYKTFHCSLIEPAGNTWMIMEDLMKRGFPESLLIFGSGPHGMNLQSFARYFGVKRIVAVELNDYRRGFARGMGASHEIYKSADALNGREFDAVIDVVGVKAIIDTVLEKGLVKEGGIVGLFGLPKEANRTVETVKGSFDMSKFIFEKMEDAGKTKSGKRFTYVGYTGRTDHALKSIIEALQDKDRGRDLQRMLMCQLRIAGPLNNLKGMIDKGFPANMSTDDMKIGFTEYER